MFVEDKVQTSLAQDAGSQSHHHFVASISNSSTPLGRCLENALLSMKITNSTKVPKQQNGREKDTGANLEGKGFSVEQGELDSDAIQSIRKTFGGSMARLQISESQRLSTGTSSEHSHSANERSRRSAPRALMYGRLDHYNRVGQNWRLVVDNARVTKRQPLLRERRTKRRRYSLWYAATTPPVGGHHERKQERNEGRHLSYHGCGEIQILGYDDL
jgi:hypothetical protein